MENKKTVIITKLNRGPQRVGLTKMYPSKQIPLKEPDPDTDAKESSDTELSEPTIGAHDGVNEESKDVAEESSTVELNEAKSEDFQLSFSSDSNDADACMQKDTVGDNKVVTEALPDSSNDFTGFHLDFVPEIKPLITKSDVHKFIVKIENEMLTEELGMSSISASYEKGVTDSKDDVKTNDDGSSETSSTNTSTMKRVTALSSRHSGSESPTMAGGRRSSKRSSTADLSNPAFRKPFDFGWKRELVYRNSTDSTSKVQADVYYYTPKNKKIRSNREVVEHLHGTGLTTENFTFFKDTLNLNDPSKEIIRSAAQRSSIGGEFIPLVKKTPAKKKEVVKEVKVPKPKATPLPRESRTPKSTALPISLGAAGPRASSSAPGKRVFPRIKGAKAGKASTPGRKAKKPVDTDDEMEMGTLPPDWHIKTPSPPSKLKSSADESPTKRKSGAEELPTKRKSGAEDSPTKRKTSAEDSPTKRKAGAEDSPTKRKAGAEDSPTKRKAGAEDSPTKRKAGTDDTTPTKRKSGSDDSPTKRKANTDDSPAKRKASTDDTQSPTKRAKTEEEDEDADKEKPEDEDPGSDAKTDDEYGGGSEFMRNFASNLSEGYCVFLQVFQYLKTQELLRAARVCKMWRDLAGHRSLWRTVRLKNSHVEDWQGLVQALCRYETRHLDLRKMLLPSDPVENEKMWREFSKYISKARTLNRIDLCRCPPFAVEDIALQCPQLLALNAITIKCSTLSLSSFGNLTNLVELRLKSMTGAHLEKDLKPIKELTNLKYLAMTTFKDIGQAGCENFKYLTNLETFELGECVDLPESFGQDVLMKMTKLQRLRLEKGQGKTCFTFKLLEAVRELPQLSQLELINYDVKIGFETALAQCTNIRRLLLIPTYVTQSATTNYVVFEGVTKLSQSLSHFVWGVTQELLRVTELFVDQCDSNASSKAPVKSKDTKKDTPSSKKLYESIPILKPGSLDRAENLENLSREELRDGKTNAGQVEIQTLHKLQKQLVAALPNTKIKIVKIPFHATWKQTIADPPHH